ncbi:hypothetical protein [Nonomuraea rubra]|uniref:hypothetical protein n=1 Tax=Nonomuraea rubra TaxID=46180 RepID=UPI0033C1CE77
MRGKIKRARGRVSAKALIVVAGAAGVVATVVAVAGGGSTTSAGQQNASPQSAQQDIAGNGAPPAASQLWHKPNAPAASEAPALPQDRSAGRGVRAGGTGQAGTGQAGTGQAGTGQAGTGQAGTGQAGAELAGTLSDRARAGEARDRREFVRPQRPAGTTGDRHPPRPGHRAKRGSSASAPDAPASSGRVGGGSLLGMRCDEMFPPHRHELRVRNLACHRLLG